MSKPAFHNVLFYRMIPKVGKINMNSYNPICFPTLDSLLSQPAVIGQNAVIKQPMNHVKQRLAEAAEQLKLVNSLCVCVWQGEHAKHVP